MVLGDLEGRWVVLLHFRVYLASVFVIWVVLRGSGGSLGGYTSL